MSKWGVLFMVLFSAFLLLRVAKTVKDGDGA